MTQLSGPWRQINSGHVFLININPQPTRFVRWGRTHTHAPLSPGFVAESPEDLGTYMVRVHQQGSGSTTVTEAITGVQERGTTWGCIMPPEVPFRSTDGEDQTTRIHLTHPQHGEFRLRRLRAIEEGGTRIGWQSDLERISGRWDPQPDQGLPAGPPFVVTPYAGGRPTLESDPSWVFRMQAVDEYLTAHPEETPAQAFQALDLPTPPARTLQAWRKRWRDNHPEPALVAPETPVTDQLALPPRPTVRVRAR